MSDIDLETLRTEYESARAELNQLRQGLKRAEHAVTAAQSALVDAMIEAGLTEYGPITSRPEWHEPSETFRTVWATRGDTR
jgi:multidrug efflux pump subunit AcrA (membrane-fusion protein)